MNLTKRLVAAAIAIASITMSANAGERTVGITGGYNTRNESAVAGLFFRYRVARLFRVSPDLTYLIRHHDTDGLMFNFNLNMPLHIVPKVEFYPLAGLNWTSWNFHPGKVSSILDDSKDVTNRVNRLGLNLGGGLDIRVTPSLSLFLEAKYTLARRYPSTTISAGIGYAF